ncbi:MAG: energy-coupled thiamine transporter ThiT [Lachnospiraceae bacterium]|nr:energy-coupled thiamine transporter ThiT [Lachnospiraceae bacterium]
MSQTQSFSRARKLAESAIMVTIATVLYILKLMELPYGGAVTIASMLPVIIISYRHGIRWGLLTGFVFGVLQQLLGLQTLSYVTTWQSILAVILLDYLIAFMCTGFGGVFKEKMSQPNALGFGALLVCVLRYLCHVISGATVWAGLSIPTNAALIYSLGYNATYMIPETIVTTALAFAIGSTLDFRSDRIRHLQPKNRRESNKEYLLKLGGILALAIALVFDVRFVFAGLQNAETGDFDITGLAAVNWTAVAVVSLICIVTAIVLFVIAYRIKKREKTDQPGE